MLKNTIVVLITSLVIVYSLFFNSSFMIKSKAYGVSDYYNERCQEKNIDGVKDNQLEIDDVLKTPNYCDVIKNE